MDSWIHWRSPLPRSGSREGSGSLSGHRESPRGEAGAADFHRSTGARGSVSCLSSLLPSLSSAIERHQIHIRIDVAKNQRQLSAQVATEAPKALPAKTLAVVPDAAAPTPASTTTTTDAAAAAAAPATVQKAAVVAPAEAAAVVAAQEVGAKRARCSDAEEEVPSGSALSVGALRSMWEPKMQALQGQAKRVSELLVLQAKMRSITAESEKQLAKKSRAAVVSEGVSPAPLEASPSLGDLLSRVEALEGAVAKRPLRRHAEQQEKKIQPKTQKPCCCCVVLLPSLRRSPSIREGVVISVDLC